MHPNRLQSSPITNYFKTSEGYRKRAAPKQRTIKAFVKREKGVSDIQSGFSAVRKPLSECNKDLKGAALRCSPQVTSGSGHKGVIRKKLPSLRRTPTELSSHSESAADVKPLIAKKSKEPKMLRCHHGLELVATGDSPRAPDVVIDLTAHSPKRLCLIDLTESPVVVDLDHPVTPVEAVPPVGNDLTVPEEDKKREAKRLSVLLDEAFTTPPPSPDSTVLPAPQDEATPLTVSIALADLSRKVKSLKLTSPHLGVTSYPGVAPHPGITSPSDAIDSLFVCSGETLESDLELLLWERGVPYTKEPGLSSVRPFTKTQLCIIENMMENGSSSKLHTILSYLRISTTALFIPRASCLHRLWKMATDTQVTADQGSLKECINYFRRLLSYHTPGRHPAVDTVYSEFISLLGPEGTVWEEISHLTCGPEHHSHLLSFIVDLLISDFWWHSRQHERSSAPLFVKVFWKSPDHHHTTGAVRTLVDMTMNCWDSNQIELCTMESLMSLLFMVGSWCNDLETELLIASRKLPTHHQTLFLSYIRPNSLKSKLAHELHAVHEAYSRLVGAGWEPSSPKLAPPISNCSPPTSQSEKVSNLDCFSPPQVTTSEITTHPARPRLSYCKVNVPRAQCTEALKRFRRQRQKDRKTLPAKPLYKPGGKSRNRVKGQCENWGIDTNI